jgi:hypothetical protein
MPAPDYEQILQSSNHGVIATDESGKIVFIHKRIKAILLKAFLNLWSLSIKEISPGWKSSKSN